MFVMPGTSYSGTLPPLTEEQQFAAARLKDTVETLAASIGPRSLSHAPRGLEEAGQYIEERMRNLGFETEAQEYVVDSGKVKSIEEYARSHGTNVSVFGKKVRNIISTLKGTTNPEEIVVIGAHYDAVFDSPGANDNASGVACMLELARAFADTKHARTIRFVGFTNEEPPFFASPDMGSIRYADLCASRNEKIVAMLSLETLGYYTEIPDSQKYPAMLGAFYPNKGNYVAFIGNLQSSGLTRKCVDVFRRSSKFPCEGLAAPESIQGVDFSDQQGFWLRGYPAVMVTDTAFLRYDLYHTKFDTVENVNCNHLARVSTGLKAVLEELAGASRD